MQLLGSNKLVELSIVGRDSFRLSIEMPTDAACVRGSVVGVHFAGERLHLFDPMTTQNLSVI